MPIFKKKAQTQPPTENNTAGDEKQFRTFAYYLAWIGFVGAVCLAVRDVLKDHEIPRKHEYYK